MTYLNLSFTSLAKAERGTGMLTGILKFADNVDRSFFKNKNDLNFEKIVTEVCGEGTAVPEGLKHFTDALNREADLNFLGRRSLFWEVRRMLQNKKFIEDQVRSHPEAFRLPIKAPIFIIGLPRAGTTFLHSLLAADQGHITPRVWQVMHPARRPADFDPQTSKECRKADRQLKIFRRLSPDFGSMHPISADSPQECGEIMADTFESIRFGDVYEVPSYVRWLDKVRGYREAYTYHKKFLQYVGYGLPGRFVLKCPDHSFALDTITAIYPDAKFVLVHRDPAHVMASGARLTEVFRAPFTRTLDPLKIGTEVCETWEEGTRRLVEFDLRTDIPAAAKISVHYQTLIKNPLAIVKEIYTKFETDLSAETAENITKLLAARPRGGYGRNRYDPARYGFSKSELREKFKNYVTHFGIEED